MESGGGGGSDPARLSLPSVAVSYLVEVLREISVIVNEQEDRDIQSLMALKLSLARNNHSKDQLSFPECLSPEWL